MLALLFSFAVPTEDSYAGRQIRKKKVLRAVAGTYQGQLKNAYTILSILQPRQNLPLKLTLPPGSATTNGTLTTPRGTIPMTVRWRARVHPKGRYVAYRGHVHLFSSLVVANITDPQGPARVKITGSRSRRKLVGRGAWTLYNLVGGTGDVGYGTIVVSKRAR